MTEVELERFTLGVFTYLPPALARDFACPADVDFDEHVSFFCDDIALRVRQAVYGETLESIECRYPRDWWAAFRERWFPAWALRRWPVIYHVTVLEARALYPKISLPGEPHHLVFLQDGSPASDD